MLTYHVEQRGDLPIYEYLYRCVREDILSGELAGGTKMPSKRNFAKHLGVSVITVENAYAQLLDEGYLDSVPRSGFYVAKLSEVHKPREFVAESKEEHSKEQDKAAQQINVADDARPVKLDFSSNLTKSENFPFSVWAKLMREELSESRDELMKLSPCSGLFALRQAIANYLHSYRGMEVDPRCIVIGAGTEYLYGLLIELLGRDKIYYLENPGYKKIAKIYKSHEVNFSYVDLDDKGLDIGSLAQTQGDVIHISPTHHFPTGITMPVSRRYEILAWAAQKDGRIIIEDDYDSEFRLTGRLIPTLKSMDALGKVIYMNTFSKSLSSTIRISYMILPDNLADKYYKELSFYSCPVSGFEQHTLARFISEGYFEKHLNRMRLYYNRLRNDVIKEYKQSKLAKMSTISEQDSGLHFVIQLKTDKNIEVIKAELLKEGIRIASLNEYYNEDKEELAPSFLVNYSNLETEGLREAFDLIASKL